VLEMVAEEQEKLTAERDNRKTHKVNGKPNPHLMRQ